MFQKNTIVGVIGAGAMGSGIAQVAATAGHSVLLFDTRKEAVEKAILGLSSTLNKLVEKAKISKEDAHGILSRIKPAFDLKELSACGLVIEAIVEILSVKKEVFSSLETIVSDSTVLASNTSSLSVTSIAAACKIPSRVIGLHFFNPAPLMPLVEVIPAVQTHVDLAGACKELMLKWKKVPVITKDTPGFIVNRVARPYYGEALRICEEGIADMATIDWALKEKAGFRMGPFELMDLIGNDINYTVTETVWTQMYFDPRYKPSLIQKKMMESGRLGRKTGMGYFSYADGTVNPLPEKNDELAKQIVDRVLSMLINEAADALHYQIASANDIDLAMTKGVNYPKGLLAWADEIGVSEVVRILDNLYNEYHEDRYRASVLLRRMSNANKKFYN